MKKKMNKKRITYSLFFAAAVFVLCTAQTCKDPYTAKAPAPPNSSQSR